MRKFENNCVGCETCMGNRCSKKRQETYYCDRCGEEVEHDDLYEVDGDEICFECRLDMLANERVEDVALCV